MMDRKLQLLLGIMIFLFMFNPLNIANLLLLVLMPFVYIEVIRTRFSLVIDVQFVNLAIFTGVYAYMIVFYDFFGINVAVKYTLHFLTFYILGRIAGYETESMLKYFLYMVILGLASFGILSVLYTVFVYGGAFGASGRMAAVPWLGTEMELSPTNIGVHLALGLSLAGVIFSDSDLKTRLINISVLALCVYSVLTLSNRTGLIIAAMSFILVFLLQMKFGSIKKKLVLLIVCSLCFFLAATIFESDALGVGEAWQGSGLYDRLQKEDLGGDLRFIAWAEALSATFTTVVGGKTPPLTLSFAHNLWLDVGWSTGLLPFLLLISFTALTARNCYQLLGSHYSPYIKLLLAACLIGFLLQSFVEPVLEGSYTFFTAFCFFSGILTSMKTMARQERAMPVKQRLLAEGNM